MNRRAIRALVGQMVVVAWRDVQTDPGWRDNGLALKSAQAETVGFLVGLNKQGELVVASSRAEGEYGDCTVIPLKLVCGLHKLERAVPSGDDSPP